jgi:hypothetical protein
MLRVVFFSRRGQTLLFVRRSRGHRAPLLNTLCRSCPAIFATGISRVVHYNVHSAVCLSEDIYLRRESQREKDASERRVSVCVWCVCIAACFMSAAFSAKKLIYWCSPCVMLPLAAQAFKRALPTTRHCIGTGQCLDVFFSSNWHHVYASCKMLKF